jgi:hypothetical protein
MTDAELGALTRQRLEFLAAQEIKAATPAVMASVPSTRPTRPRDRRPPGGSAQGQIIPGFKVGDHKVKALDLTRITDLHEIVSMKQLGRYNTALHLVGMSLLDPETTTYATLLDKRDAAGGRCRRAHRAREDQEGQGRPRRR